MKILTIIVAVTMIYCSFPPKKILSVKKLLLKEDEKFSASATIRRDCNFSIGEQNETALKRSTLTIGYLKTSDVLRIYFDHEGCFRIDQGRIND